MNIPTIIRKANNRSVLLRHYFLWRNAPSRSAVRRKFLFYIQRQPSTFIKIRSWKWRQIQLNPRLHVTFLSHQRALFKPHRNICTFPNFGTKFVANRLAALSLPAWSHAEAQRTWRWGIGGCYVHGLRYRVEENNSYTYRESNRDAVPSSTDCQCQTVIKSLL